MPLPLHYLFVAGLGRRQIGPEAEIRAALASTLQTIAAAAPDAQPVAMASGAAGADQVFLEAALGLGWPIRLVLPVPAYLFEEDFTSHDASGGTVVDSIGLERFSRLHDAALEIEVISPSPDRRIAFTRCANTLVAEADVVVALWDGQPGKQGGTNESLLLAAQLDIPVVTLDAQTGLPADKAALGDTIGLGRHHRTRHQKGDAANTHHDASAAAAKSTILHDIDEALRHSLAPDALAAFHSSPARVQRDQLGDHLATRARKLSDSFKTKILLAIRVHGLATAAGTFAVLFFVGNGLVSNAAGGFKLLAVGFATGLVLWVKRLGAQSHWVKARYVREITRSLAASAPVCRATGEAHATFVPASIWVLFRELRLPLLFFHRFAAAADPAKPLLQAIRDYRRDRLIHAENHRALAKGKLSQRDYQLRTGEEAEHEHHRIDRWFWIATGAFFLCAVLVLIPPFHHHFDLLYRGAKWLTLLLPVLTAALLILPNLKDLHRRRRVAPALAATLARLDTQLAQVETALGNLAAGRVPLLPSDIPVWMGPPDAQAHALEAWARTRFAAIAREAEHAILTEVIGFKTFTENVEVG